MRGGRRGGCGLRFRRKNWRIREGFEVVDFRSGDIDEAGLISIDVEAGDGADDLAAFVADGESVAKDGGVGGEAGEREQRDAECELE